MILVEVAVSAEKEWQEAEEETKAELQKIYVETVQEIVSELPPPANMLAAGTKCVIKCRVRGCSSSPCLTE